MTPDTEPEGVTVRTLLRVNQFCDEFEAAHRAGQPARIEEFVDRAPADASVLLEHLIPIELAYRRRLGELPRAEDYAARFPQFDRTRLARLFPDAVGGKIPPVLGEYELVRPIGAGGMGVVHLARHRRMNRLVALKAVLPDVPNREVLQRRFAREVEITARLSHPNVVVAFDAREDSGVTYLVTAYLEGGDLGRAVRRSGPLPIPAAIDAAREAALGLAHAHERGIVHRDVKPSNLLLDGTGRVCVADWGLARGGDDRPVASNLTAAGQVLGTVDYLAPEQAGNPTGADSRSDVYSLGCVLFFLLAGRPPFDRGTAWERLDAHRDTPAPDVSNVRPDAPRPLAELVARMLAKEPEDRPAGMAAVIAALDAMSERRSFRLTRRSLLLGGAALVAAAGFGRWRLARDAAPALAELPLADAREYQRQWAEHLGVPVERVDTVGGVPFDFVLVPPGRFRMGTPDEWVERLAARANLNDWGRDRYLAERERVVTIRRPFYLGKTEVTVRQFEVFVTRDGHKTLAERGTPGWGYHGAGEGWKLGPYTWRSAGQYTPPADHPVVNVAWADAVRFCKWLGAETGGTCRLPAESEWEFACRGGRQSLWGHGNDPESLAAFAVLAADTPAPVGSRRPNDFGLFDMHGNSAERCAVEDPWTDDPHRPATLGGDVYPVRGGRFNEIPPGSADAWPDPYRCGRRSWEGELSMSAGVRVLLEIPG